MNDNELIERFLHGRLDPKDSAAFCDRLLSDQELQRLFQKEVAVESQIYDQSLACKPIQRLTSEKEWHELTCRETTTESDRITTGISDDEWRMMVDHAVKNAPLRKKRYFFSATPARRYLAAAAIFLAAGATVFLFNNTIRHQVTKIVTTPETMRQPQPPENQYRSFPVIRITDSNTAAITTVQQTEIIAIDTQTAAVAERHTTIECAEYRDTAITLDMTSGDALFSVEKGKYRFFKVITPFAEITVTGTIFRITIDTTGCFVNVETGSVNVRHTGKDLTMQVQSGKTVRADDDTLMEVWVERSISEMLARKRLLADFLAKPASLLHDPVVPAESGRRRSPDDSAIRNLKQAILNGTPGIDTTVHSFISEHKGDSAACGLLLDLSRSYEGRRKWYEAARILDKIDLCDSGGSSRLLETVLYRKGRLYLQAGDTATALGSFTQFRHSFPESVWYPDILDLEITALRQRGNIHAADSILSGTLRQHPQQLPDDRSLMTHAASLRDASQFKQALTWYEYIAAKQPEGNFTGDAMYWAGWCIVQHNITNREKRAFNHK